MARVILSGWNKGFQKVSMARLLQEYGGYSLSSAKSLVDRVLAGETVEIEVDDPRLAGELVERAEKIGARLELA